MVNGQGGDGRINLQKPRNISKKPRDPAQWLLYSEAIKNLLLKNQSVRGTQQSETETGKLELVESGIDSGTQGGILSEINSKNSIDFSFFADEGLTLEELKNLNLSRIPGLPESDTLRINVEKAIVKHIKTEFQNRLSNGLKNRFSEKIRYNNESLQELINTINFFADELRTEQEKNQFLDFKNNFFVSFLDIKNNLEPILDPATNQDINENLSTKSFGDWTESQQKTFDYMFSKVIIQRLKDRISRVESASENLTSTLCFPLSLRSIYSKHPFTSYEELLNYADESEQQRLVDISESFDQADEDQQSILEQESEQIFWACYLRQIAESDPELATALGKLYENDFDFSSLNNDPESRDHLIKQLAAHRLDQLKESNVIGVFGNDPEKFEKFFQELFDFSKDEITINGKTLHVKKEFLPGKNMSLKELAELPNAKELPIRFTVSGLDNLQLSGEDQQVFDVFFNNDKVNNEIVLENDKVGKLLVFYLMGVPGFIENYNPDSEAAKRLSDLLSEEETEAERIRRKIDEAKGELDADEDGEVQDSEENALTPEQQAELDKEKFLAAWKDIRGDAVEDEDGGFRPGAILYCPFGESSLPPHLGNDWLKLTVSYVDWDNKFVRVKCNGVELKLNGGNENRTIEFPMEIFQERFLKGDTLVDRPYKILSEKTDFEKTFGEMFHEGLCEGGLLADTQFEGGKLMMSDLDKDGKETKERVSYFGTGLNVDDRSKVLYEVKRNPDNTVSLSSTSFLGEDDKTYRYEKTMTYPEFLVFVQEKNLMPKTKSMAEREKKKITDIISSRGKKIKWVSINSLIYSVKTIWKKVNEGMENYQKRKNEECLDLITRDHEFYKKLDKWIGWTAPSLSSALKELHDEATEGADKKTWEEIKKRVDEFKGLNDYANLFENGVDKPGTRLAKLDAALGKFKTLKEVLISRTSVVNNENLRPVMAAAMISNLKIGNGLYRGMAEYDNQGLWVQCLLGPQHYQRYMQYKRNLIENIKKGGKEAKQLRDLLVKSEAYYIINNIQNSHGKDEYFPSVSDENRQVLKQLYSNEFASQLEEAMNEKTGQGAVDSSYNKMKQKFNTFNPVYEEFKKNIKSGRIEAGLGALMRLGELAVEPKHHMQLKVALSYITLSGILNRYANKDMIDRFDGIARAYMLPTAFFAGKDYHQRYAWYLLGKATRVKDGGTENLGFTEYMKGKGLTQEKFSRTSGAVPYGDLLSELEKWWMVNNDDIDKFFLSLKTKDLGGDPILEDIANVLREKNPDNINDSRKSKPSIVGHYGINQTPDVIYRYKQYGKEGFTAKDSDERNDKIEFWKKLYDDLRNLENNPDVKPEFFLKEFKNFFLNDGFSDGYNGDNIARIRLIKKIREQIGQPMEFTHKDKTGEYKIQSDDVYGEKEVKSLMRYLFKGKVLSNGPCQPPREFERVLDFFQRYFEAHFDEISEEKVLKDVFKPAPRDDDIEMQYLIPWDEYARYVQKEDRVFSNDTEAEEPEAGTLVGKEAKKWKKSHFKDEYFVNNELAQMEKQLRRNGVIPPVRLLKSEKGGIKITPTSTSVNLKGEKVKIKRPIKRPRSH